MIRLVGHLFACSLAAFGLLVAVCVPPVLYDGGLTAGVLAVLAPLTEAHPVGDRFAPAMTIVWPLYIGHILFWVAVKATLLAYSVRRYRRRAR